MVQKSVARSGYFPGTCFTRATGLGASRVPRVSESGELELAEVEVALLHALALRGDVLQVERARRGSPSSRQVELAALVLDEAVLLVVDEALDVHALAEGDARRRRGTRP